MAAKRFHIETPEQLQELDALAKEQPSGLHNLIRMWTVEKRRRAVTAWDNSFYIFFSGTRERIAAIIRFDTRHELRDEVPVRYNKALNWCEQHLREVYD